MSYTPGPWRMCYSDEFGGGNIRSDHHQDGTGALLLEAGSMFHDYAPDRDEEFANLRLAAASPELLEAAIHALEVLQDRDWSGIGHLRSQLEAAIAKAKATTGQEEER